MISGPYRRTLQRLGLGLLAIAAVCLAGCDRRKNAAPPPPVPAVKTVLVRPQADVQQRSLAGLLIVAEETRLSFAVGGKLLEVPLRDGDAFSSGQVIARLDAMDFERELVGEKARLASANSRLREAEEIFRRQESLASSGTVSRATLERAEAARAAARSDQRVAEVAVSSAEENLRRTRLIAPRNGIVTRKVAQQFEEVSPGQPVYEVGSRDALEVVVLVPEHLVPRLKYGAEVSVILPGLQDRTVRGQIVSIGATAEAGSAFRVKARLDEAPAGARSGMSASVQLTLPSEGNGQPVFSVPLAALAFESAETGPVVGRKATLFVYDPAAQVVRRREVPVAGMAGNQVFVTGGLAPGERVVSAGVAFLRDGQKARLWTPPE